MLQKIPKGFPLGDLTWPGVALTRWPQTW